MIGFYFRVIKIEFLGVGFGYGCIRSVLGDYDV